MRRIQTLLIISFSLGFFLMQCRLDSPPPPDKSPQSSWEIIQQTIFEAKCTTCHVSGMSFAEQSDLILTEDVAYEQLMNRQPKNESARNYGLMLLSDKGLESLYTSFLWEKINVYDREHFYNDHPEYGEQMPLGGPPLTNGELEYIRKWILAGAPETGFVADAALLKDTSIYSPPPLEFEPLEPPVSGYQLHLGPFPVIPNYEREFFYYKELNNPEPIYVNRFQTRMRAGTHHFILYDFKNGGASPTPDEFRDLRHENGLYNFATIVSLQDQLFFYGTQWRETDYRLPEGVALRVEANKGFDMNSHYVNRTNDTTYGEIYTNIHTIPVNEVEHVAENLFLSNEDFTLPAGKKTTVSRTYTFGEKRNIFLLTSHAHEHMTDFKIYISGGSRNNELIYFTQDWQHPPLLQFNPPLVLNAGEGLKAVATYDNNTSEDLVYGLLSEDEMMIIFGAFYKD